MTKNILKIWTASFIALACTLACGIFGGAKVTASTDSGMYTQNFTDVNAVNEDFQAYYQTAMGASAVKMDVGDSSDDYANWYISDGALIRKTLDNDVSSTFETESFAILTLTKRTYVNFELTVEYLRSADTYYWPVVAFRQTEPGQYFLEDGVGVFVQRDGKTTMWGGEGVGGPYENSSRGGYVDGEWHTLKVHVEGVTVSVYVDGDTAPALSRNLPAGMFRHGYISLTSVNNTCAFRNLTIKELAITDIDQNESQAPADEADTDDSLGNLAEDVEDIDELNGLKQNVDEKQDDAQTQENGCGSSFAGSTFIVLAAMGAVITAKKIRKTRSNS